jgi:hypothetical protein
VLRRPTIRGRSGTRAVRTLANALTELAIKTILIDSRLLASSGVSEVLPT